MRKSIHLLKQNFLFFISNIPTGSRNLNSSSKERKKKVRSYHTVSKLAYGTMSDVFLSWQMFIWKHYGVVLWQRFYKQSRLSIGILPLIPVYTALGFPLIYRLFFPVYRAIFYGKSGMIFNGIPLKTLTNIAVPCSF